MQVAVLRAARTSTQTGRPAMDNQPSHIGVGQQCIFALFTTCTLLTTAENKRVASRNTHEHAHAKTLPCELAVVLTTRRAAHTAPSTHTSGALGLALIPCSVLIGEPPRWPFHRLAPICNLCCEQPNQAPTRPANTFCARKNAQLTMHTKKKRSGGCDTSNGVNLTSERRPCVHRLEHKS